MFLDDLIFGGRRQMTARSPDILAFASDWGFQVSDIKRCRCAGGTATTTTSSRSHTANMVSLLPDAKLYPLPGDSHLSTLHQRPTSSTSSTPCGTSNGRPRSSSGELSPTATARPGPPPSSRGCIAARRMAWV